MKVKVRVRVSLACLACLMVGCKSYEYSTATPLQAEQQVQSVKTVGVPSAHVSVTIDQQVYTGKVSFSTTIDSLVIWSIQPIVGVELFRLEATPNEAVVYDKTTMTRIPLTYNQVTQYSSPALTFDHLQEIATGEILPMGRTSTLRSYVVLGHTVILDIDYKEIRYNVPVNMNRLSALRFEEKQLEEMMK